MGVFKTTTVPLVDLAAAVTITEATKSAFYNFSMNPELRLLNEQSANKRTNADRPPRASIYNLD